MQRTIAKTITEDVVDRILTSMQAGGDWLYILDEEVRSIRTLQKDGDLITRVIEEVLKNNLPFEVFLRLIDYTLEYSKVYDFHIPWSDRVFKYGNREAFDFMIEKNKRNVRFDFYAFYFERLVQNKDRLETVIGWIGESVDIYDKILEPYVDETDELYSRGKLDLPKKSKIVITAIMNVLGLSFNDLPIPSEGGPIDRWIHEEDV